MSGTDPNADVARRTSEASIPDIPDGYHQLEKSGILAPVGIPHRIHPDRDPWEWDQERCQRERVEYPTISLAGFVGEDLFRMLSEMLGNIGRGDSPVKLLRVDLATYGGDAAYGLGIHDLLRAWAHESGKKVQITGYGPVASAGAVILMAADFRRMSSFAELHFHPLHVEISDETEIPRTLAEIEALKRAQDMVEQIIANRSHIGIGQVHTMLVARSSGGTYFTAHEALKIGLIDNVV